MHITRRHAGVEVEFTLQPNPPPDGARVCGGLLRGGRWQGTGKGKAAGDSGTEEKRETPEGKRDRTDEGEGDHSDRGHATSRQPQSQIHFSYIPIICL